MNVALIGYGYWGKIVERYIEASSVFYLKYVSTRHSISHKKYADLQAIQKDAEIDAVFICTPISTHFEICQKFLDAGKHIFCEKPIVKSLEEYELLLGLADKKGLVIYTDWIYTVSPSINWMKENICKAGRLISISGSIEQFGNFYADGTALEVIASHLIAAVQYIAGGIPCEVKRYGFAFEQGVRYKLDGGCEVNLYSSLIARGKSRRLRILGEKGIIDFSMTENPSLILRKTTVIGNKISVETEQTIHFDENDGITRVLNSFLLALKCSSIAERNIRVTRSVLKVIYDKQ